MSIIPHFGLLSPTATGRIDFVEERIIVEVFVAFWGGELNGILGYNATKKTKSVRRELVGLICLL